VGCSDFPKETSYWYLPENLFNTPLQKVENQAVEFTEIRKELLKFNL
jgi:hypothetical protein